MTFLGWKKEEYPTFVPASMNKLIAIALMMCLGCQLVLKLSIVAWFEINQEYIAATLCENKNKPELVCCGKCVLTKKLKKADDLEQKSQNSQPTKEERTAMVMFILPEQTILPSAFIEQITIVQNPGIASHFGIEVQRSIFHPPAFICS